MPRIASRIKSLFVPTGSRPRRVLTGAFRELALELDLANETQVWLGLAEREVYSCLAQLSENVRTAFDIGAASGEYALYFLRKTEAEKVFAFEPQDSCRERLQRNLALNGLANCDRLILSGDCVGAERRPGWTALDDLIPDITPPTIVKMDIDGGEVDALMGARALLQQQGTRWLIETHSKELEKQCINILAKAGYSTTIIPNAWWRFFVPEMRVSEMNRWLVGARRE